MQCLEGELLPEDALCELLDKFLELDDFEDFEDDFEDDFLDDFLDLDEYGIEDRKLLCQASSSDKIPPFKIPCVGLRYLMSVTSKQYLFMRFMFVACN